MRHYDIRALTLRLGPNGLARRLMPIVLNPILGIGRFRLFSNSATSLRKRTPGGTKKNKKAGSGEPLAPSPPSVSHVKRRLKYKHEEPIQMIKKDPATSKTRKELMDVYRSNPFAVLDFQDPDTPDAGMRYASRENLLLDAETEDNAPTEEFEVADSGRHTFLKRGDLVQLMTTTTGTQSLAAVYIRTLENGLSQFLTMHGQVKYERDTRVIFTVPDYFSPTSLQPIIPYMPKNLQEYRKMMNSSHLVEWDVPRHVAASVLKSLQEFWMECENLQRREAARLPQAHASIADASEPKFLTLQEVVSILVPADSSNPATVFMIERALSWFTLQFSINNIHHRTSRIIHIRSKQFVERAKKVRDAIRDYQTVLAGTDIPGRSRPKVNHHSECVTQFVGKCRRLIEESRRLRQTLPTASSLGPLHNDGTALEAHINIHFTKVERHFIWFLEQLSLTSAFSVDTSMTALGSFLIRDIGLYDHQCDTMPFSPETGYRLLQEIGAIRPFENKALHDPELCLPGYGPSSVLDFRKKVVDSMDPSEFTDTMKRYRRDWGSMDVYCIDATTAEEIDDGISLERINGTDDEFWVHVHVANPTAFFNRYDILGQATEQSCESVYLPEGTFNLLPKQLTSDIWSLGPQRPALTFSIRLNTDGEILEKTVTSSIVNEVHRLTPEQASEIVCPKVDMASLRNRDVASLSVGVQPTQIKQEKSRGPEFDSQQRQDLAILYSLAQARLNQRLLAGTVDMEVPQPNIQLSHQEDIPSLLERSFVYKSNIEIPVKSEISTPDPSITFAGYRFDPHPFGSPTPGSLLVREMMVLAGQAAGQWMDERKIPAVYRLSARNEDLQDPQAYYRDVYLPACMMSADGKTVLKPPPRAILSEYLNLLGKVTASTTPGPHLSLGVDRYVKVTSPLRRYGDMIAHWQIEAYIRAQDRGRKLAHSTLPSPSPTVQLKPEGSSLRAQIQKLALDRINVSDLSQTIDSQNILFPFNEHILSTHTLPLLAWREKRIRIATQRSIQHWSSLLFFRAFYFKGQATAPLPEVWTVHVDPREWISGQATTDTAEDDIENGDASGGSLGEPSSSSTPNPFELYHDPEVSENVTSPVLAAMSVVPIPTNKSANAGLIKGTLVENSMRCLIRIPKDLKPAQDDDEPKIWNARLAEVNVYNGHIIFEAISLQDELDE